MSIKDVRCIKGKREEEAGGEGKKKKRVNKKKGKRKEERGKRIDSNINNANQSSHAVVTYIDYTPKKDSLIISAIIPPGGSSLRPFAMVSGYAPKETVSS